MVYATQARMNGMLAKRFLQKIRSFQSMANASFAPELLSSNLMISAKQKPKQQLPNEPNMVSIYRVPANMRQLETKAYDPNIVSIGPYNRGLARLQAMEEIKKKSFHRLLNDPNWDHGVTLETLCDAMKSLEGKARACYSETIKLESDEFLETMVIDGCFILELFRESVKERSTRKPVFTPLWTLPLLRRDLIMLENQIPSFVLSRLFDLTRYPGNPMTTSSLTDLALKFFNPLMPRDHVTLNESIATTRNLGGEHLLDLFRSSLLPRSSMIRGKQPHMFRSIKEIQDAGVKLEKRENHGTLDMSFMKVGAPKILPWHFSFMKVGVLKIPPLIMEDYTGTLLRNIVAFEQCHSPCKPDFTSYVFFIDGLINTAEDVGLLHYAGVIQHSLGSEKELADLFNGLCREVARDVDESYLRSLSMDLNEYCNRNWNRWRATLVHDYFSSPWTLLSLISAFLFLALTVIQTYFVMHRQ